MDKPVQLLLPLEFPEDNIPLPREDEEKLVAALADLLLQILSVEEVMEVTDELYH